MTTRAAIYARVSSQAQRERHTIENQLRELPAFVASQGWTLVETYVDDGRSARAGKLEAREAFARLVKDADAKRFDVVVVVEIDRLTRTDDLEERARILGPFQRNGIQIVTPSGGALDLRTMLGELYATMQALFAAEDNRKRSERIKQGRVTAATRGRLPAGRPPWGLAYSRESGAWIAHPERGPIVREMFERVAAGESCRVIADDMDARGVKRERGQWHRARVVAIVRAKYPTGRWVADAGRAIEVSVPRLVSDELWHRAQAMLDRSGQRGLRKTKHEYLLEGLGVCGACGAPMGIRTPDAYICSARRATWKGERGRCKAEIVQTADADARAWAAIRRELEDPDLEAAIAGALEATDVDRRDWRADAAGYERKLARLQESESKLLARFTRGSISEGAMDAELARIARERRMLQDQVAAAGRAAMAAGDRSDLLLGARGIVERLRTGMAAATFADRRALLVELVEPTGVVFHGEQVRMALRLPRPVPTISSVDASACRDVHVTHMRLRVVA